MTLGAGGDNGNTTFTGIISGDGAFIKQGGGTLTNGGLNPNTYTGTTSIEVTHFLAGIGDSFYFCLKCIDPNYLS